MLDLELEQYDRWAPQVMKGLRSAAKFLHTQHFYDPRFLPYGTQLVPLSAIFTVLGPLGENQGTQEKIAKWFWCGVLGELYGGTTETRFSRDLPDVVGWVRGTDGEPRTIADALFQPSRLSTLRTRGSAAYKGIYALLLKAGAADWRTGEPASVQAYFDNAIDIHHIFPQAWCESQGIPRNAYDAVINKTPLSARTNRVIGGRAPSDYVVRVAKGADIDATTLDQNVTTHLVEPALLRSDDFRAFMAARERALLQKVEAAMGKPSAVSSAETPPTATDDEAEDDDD